MIDNVCALVVTYNRPQLLCDCLTAIVNQSTSVSEIIILDNYSDEMTLSTLFHAQFIPQYSPEIIITGGVLQFEYLTSISNRIKIHYYRLPQNTGGAGGFNAGMRYFYEQTKCNFLWLMDDDCIPSPTALEKLIFANNMLSTKVKVGFLVSRTITPDGRACRMTHPIVEKLSGAEYYSTQLPVLVVENAAFVSFFISRDLIREFGLPIREYFIWVDDLEFSTRITAKYQGFFVLDSVVTHKTLLNQTSSDGINMMNYFKYQYGIRNKVSWLRKTKGMPHALFFSIKFFSLIISSEVNLCKKFALFCALVKGWFFNPSIELL